MAGTPRFPASAALDAAANTGGSGRLGQAISRVIGRTRDRAVDRADASASHGSHVHDPLAQLERSHRRLEEACDALTMAARDRDIETAGDVCAFFARQVRRHEEDEEQSLFPRLANAALQAVLERLSR